jgi:hypothetical protein
MTEPEDQIRRIKSKCLTDEQLDDLDGVPVLDPQEMDEAIVGAIKNDAGKLVLVYSYDKLVDYFASSFESDAPLRQLMRDHDEEYDAYTMAIEWVDYNVVRGCMYMGERSPIVVFEEDGNFPQDGETPIEINGKRFYKV